jgi:hypothetical protein
MADKKITGLTALSGGLDLADLFEVVDDPAGTPLSRKATSAQIQALMMAQGAIQGFGISYATAGAITVAAGTCNINGKQLTYAGGTLTSGTTMKDNNGSTVTLAASKSYYIYAFDNSGTLEIRVQDYAAATYGGVSVFDATYDYWKAPSVGAQARRIGKIWTSGSGDILPFAMASQGRLRTFFMNSVNAVALLANGTSNSYAAISPSPYVTTDDAHYSINCNVALSSGVGVSRIFISPDSGITACVVITSYTGAAGTNHSFANSFIPATGNLNYKVDTSGFPNSNGSVTLNGVSHYI